MVIAISSISIKINIFNNYDRYFATNNTIIKLKKEKNISKSKDYKNYLWLIKGILEFLLLDFILFY